MESGKRFRFEHPFTCLVAGPTQSGKSYFARGVIDNMDVMVEPVPRKVIWCYGEYHEGLQKLPEDVELVEGLPSLESESDVLLVLDDLMMEAGDAKEISNLFTRVSHHKNISVMLLVQNVFHQGKIMRAVSLNAHYMVLFKNPRDAGQIRHLASQLFPGQGKFLVDAYKQATESAHGYLLLDFRQSTQDNLRVRSGVLPGQESWYYVPK